MSEAFHVVPVNDLVEHDTNTSEADCICGPEIEAVETDQGGINWMIVHHSLDGREHREEQEV